MKNNLLGLNFNPSFIGIYDNIFDKDVCEFMIKQFEDGPKRPSLVWKKGKPLRDDNEKQGIEAEGSDFRSKNLYGQRLYDGLSCALTKYKKQFPALDSHLPSWNLDPEFTFKKFEGEDEGFKGWHTEHGLGALAHRILVWMVYLNDAKSGTQFKYYPNVRAKRGRIVLWPAGWTHVHRGAPNKGVKYVLSGWYSYDHDPIFDYDKHDQHGQHDNTLTEKVEVNDGGFSTVPNLSS